MFLVFLGREGSAGFEYGLSSWEYSMTQFGAITRYLRLSIWPDSLVLDYGASVTRNANEIIPAAIVVGLLACGSIVAIKYQPWIAFLGFVFFGDLAVAIIGRTFKDVPDRRRAWPNWRRAFVPSG